MTVSKQQITAVANALDSLTSSTRKLIQAELESLKINSISELRDKTIEILNKYTSSSAEIAKALGANFYDEITKGYTDKGDASTYEVDFSEANDTAVRAMVEKVRQGGSVSAFYDEIMTRVDYLCRRTMNETILEGIKSSGKKMFARVPNGRHTCAFCFMLASRGFVYWTRASAGEFNHYHSNCRCTIVPGDPDADPNTQVEGYKPSELYSRYESCVNAVDYDYDKFKELQESGKTKQTWEQWKQNKLIKEIRTRDTGWLWEGTAVEPTSEPGAKPEKKDRKFAKHLGKEYGIGCEYIKAINKDHIKTADVYINGKTVEFKIPEAWNEKTIKNQFKTAINKNTQRLYIDLRMIGVSVDVARRKVKELFDAGEFMEIRYVTLVDKERLLRMER